MQQRLQVKEKMVGDYLERLRRTLEDVPTHERDRLVEHARAQIELDLELSESDANPDQVQAIVLRRGDPEVLAKKLRSEAPLPGEQTASGGRLTACRACRREVSKDALACPHCGAPQPAVQQATHFFTPNYAGRANFGREWKSATTICGWPLVHVAYGRDQNGKLRVAKGVIAIGQFGIGAITIAQFGVGFVFGLGQFMLSPIALGQIAVGLVAIGQLGIGLVYGAGMIATGAVAHGLAAWGNWFRR